MTHAWDVARIAREAEALLTRSVSQPEGEISASVYETARIATLAPWLGGQERRFGFLLRSQHLDGSWGGPGEYALVPTLSATEALLCARRCGRETSGLANAADRGLTALRRLLGPSGPGFADMIASELLVPALVVDIERHLSALGLPGLPVSPDVDFTHLARLRELPPNAKLRHTLELYGDRAQRMPGVEPEDGNLGCSPAATAAWLGSGEPADWSHPAVRYLEDLVGRGRGTVPGVSPITTFEHAWTVGTLLSAGIDAEVPPAMHTALHAAVTGAGAAVASGLLCDADTTAATLFALAQLGDVRRPDVLRRFDTGEHFQCWPGERNPSVSANAHVLETLSYYVARRPQDATEYLEVVARLADWLIGQQRDDGSWLDKWHASPYYATVVCVRALELAGHHRPIERVVRWLLDTQRSDGSWGVWDGTAEETAYALRVLLRRRRCTTPALLRAVARGSRFLLTTAHGQHAQLWHDKDLYAPGRVIDAEILAARHLVAVSDVEGADVAAAGA